jgi:hypothetical protein
MDKDIINKAFEKYKTDKGAWRHGYHQCYGEVFKDFTPEKMLEIGVFEGRSLAAWRELFPDTIIHGLDTFDRSHPLVYSPENVTLLTGNSRNKEFVDSLPDVYDIIIDDGNHHPNVQWQTYLNFKNKWTKYYVIEDVINEEEELRLRRRLKADGIRNITTFRSSFTGNVTIYKKQVMSSFFAMVIQK